MGVRGGDREVELDGFDAGSDELSEDEDEGCNVFLKGVIGIGACWGADAGDEVAEAMTA